MAVGSVQRATKTPATMESEIKKGESPTVTNFRGAAAPANQAPAASPHITPRTCRERRVVSELSFCGGCKDFMSSMKVSQQSDAENKHDERDPELNVSENCFQIRWLHGSYLKDMGFQVSRS